MNSNIENIYKFQHYAKVLGAMMSS